MAGSAEYNRYKQFFDEADTDKSGSLTLQELKAALRRNGYQQSDDKIKAMFDAVDDSGDNLVTFDEYMRAMGQLPDRDHKAAAIRRVFRQFDKDGNGEIDRKELDAALKEMKMQMPPNEIERIMKRVDSDGSQTINYEEFVREFYS